MIKPCPSCGAVPTPEARFCRVCGAPLKAAGLAADTSVSPGAQTLPLSDEARPTRGVGGDEKGGAAPGTNKVGRREMDELLWRSTKSVERALAEAPNDTKSATAATPEDASATSPYTTRPSASKRAAALAARASSLPPQASTVETAQESVTDESGKVAAQASGGVARETRPTARTRRLWQATAAVLLLVAVVAALLAFLFSDRLRSTGTNGSPPIPLSDRQQLVDEQLAKAADLMAAGNVSEAIARLHEAVRLDQTNVEAHRRLAEALEKEGARREAIDEYRAAAQISQTDAGLWRSLASAQYAEGLYGDAVESYRRLSGLTNDELGDQVRLEYADALRQTGRTEEARANYQKLSSSTSEEIARTAKRQMTELGTPAQTAVKENARDDATQNREPEANDATSASSPSGASRPPANKNGERDNSDSFYYQALNIVNGRDIKKLPRAELVRALQLFQNVKSGQYVEQARKNAERLGKEYDRRKKW